MSDTNLKHIESVERHINNYKAVEYQIYLLQRVSDKMKESIVTSISEIEDIGIRDILTKNLCGIGEGD